MFNSHIFSRFLRLVRSIRRSLFAFFVAIAMLLATFVIAPTYALSAGENTGEKVSIEETVGAQFGSAKTDGENKQQTKQSESNNNIEPNKKNTGSSSTLTNNKESKTVEKQPNPSNDGVNKPKSDETDVKKNAKDAQKKDVDSAKAVNGTDRVANEEPQLPEECKGKKPEKCYSITYSKESSIKGSESEPYYKVPQILIPTIKVAGKVQTTLPKGVWLTLEKHSSYDSVKYAFFKGENDKNDSYTAKSTEKVANSNGYIRFFASKWLEADKSYRFKVVIHYKGVSETQFKIIKVRLDKKDLPNPKSGDLTINVNNFGSTDSTAQTGDSDKKSVSITIKPKSNSQGADKKDTYDPINKLFIDSKSIDKRGKLYHRMICKDDANNYTVDSVNGLSLKDKKDNPSADRQTQFKHIENKDRPSTGAEDSAVYESDDYTERSQSWISGTPTSAGTFECRVFAFKNATLFKKSGKHSSNPVELFDKNTETDAGKKSLFGGNIVDSNTYKTDDFKPGVDWDYKSVTIEVKSNKPPEPKPPKIGDNDLTLEVYPFKDSTTALTSDNNKISAILGMSLKPFVDATSAADSANKITLRVLCKGEKKNNAAGGSGAASTGSTGSTESGSAGSGSNGGNSGTGSNSANTDAGSQPTQPFEPSQSAEATWSSKPDGLVLSVPEDDNQNTCHSNKEGDKTCESVDPNKKVAARTDKEVSIKPTDVGNYQCVVYALKPKALAKFDGLTGSLTPATISSALTTDPASFKENKDFAAFTFNIHSVSKFTLPHTGGQSWNLQLGILAALLVNLLAAGFVVSQSERGRKLILGRWRGLCNHV